MKKLVMYSAFIIVCFGIVFACVKQEEGSLSPSIRLLDEALATNLVKEYNQNLSRNAFSIRKAFFAKGVLESKELKDENGQLFQAFLLTTFDKAGKIKKVTKFDYGLYDSIEIPEEIKNAFVVFIGNQLIIRNLDTGYQINLFVPVSKDTSNKTPFVKTVEGIYLGIETVSEIEKANASLGSCSCACNKCEPFGPCGSAECSCTCNGDGCSKVCRDGYDAVCGGCDDPIE